MVALLVLLRARAAHGRAAAAVEQPELDPAGVGDAAHRAAQGVDLADQVALAEPADGRVARHAGHRVRSQGDQRRAAAHPGGGQGGLAAGVAGPDHGDVETPAVCSVVAHG